MTESRRKEKRMHLLMWAMLTQKTDPEISWLYLFNWAVIEEESK